MEQQNVQGDAEAQKAKAIAQQIMERSRNEQAQKHVKASRTTLFVLALLFFAYAILYGGGVIADDIFSLVFYFAIGVIYIGLGIWAHTSPKAASIFGLALYILVVALIALADPTTLYKGILIKIIIIIYLMRGITEANKIPKEKAVELDTLDANMMR